MDERKKEQMAPVPINCWKGCKPGTISPVDWSFCPIVAVSKFPYKYLNKPDSEYVADSFYNAGKFWDRHWDLYYVWPPAELSGKPIIFVPKHQYNQLLQEIRIAFPDCEAQPPGPYLEPGFIVNFPNHPALRPRYLDCSSSKDEFNEMQSQVPSKSQDMMLLGDTRPPDDRSLAAFKRTVEAAIEASKNKSKNAKAKKKEDRIQKQQVMTKQLKRTQRYLGLRPRRDKEPDLLNDPTLSWSELQAAQAAQDARAQGLDLIPVNVAEPVPYPFHDSPVFVCVDIEAFERDHSLITEVGVAILDTLDLEGLAPGRNAQNWQSKIRARHFRIREYANLKNTEFISGCPERFEFGTSEFISKAQAPQYLGECFRHHQASECPTPAESSKLFPKGRSPAVEKRNIVLVGHDTSHDVEFMHKLGYNPLNLPNLLEVLDTALLYRAWKHELQPRSLGNILYDFEMAGWNLHNAGNDAVYTLWIMLAIALRDAELHGSKILQKQREAAQVEKMQTAVQETITRVMEENEGWSSGEDGDDGGVPLKPEIDLSNLSLSDSGGRSGDGSRGKKKRAGRANGGVWIPIAGAND